jgi:S-adenosylmethionine synthetase
MTDEREVLQEEIAQTREELGETVEALVNKADVKAQVHEKVEESKEELRTKQRAVTSQIADTARKPATYWALAGAAAALLALGRLRSRG